MATGYFDAICPKCQTKIGWQGTMMDRPPCRKCGHRFSREALAKEAEALDKILTAHTRPSPCGVPGHTEADLCEAAFVAGIAKTRWCGACALKRGSRREDPGKAAAVREAILPPLPVPLPKRGRRRGF